MARFGDPETEAVERYRDFVERQVEAVEPSPWEQVVGATVMGSQAFVEWVQTEFISGRGQNREVPAARVLESRPSVESIEAAVQNVLSDRPRLARKMAMYLSHRYGGRTLTEIGSRFDVGPSGVTEASRNGARTLEDQPELKRKMDFVAQELGISSF